MPRVSATLGTRYYADKQESWKEVVEILIGRASIVILHAGHTNGFLWELQTVLQKQPPERILLLISFTKLEYDKFKEATARFFPSPLPDYNGAGKAVPSSIKGFIEFDADWTSSFIRMPSRIRDILWNADGESYLDAMLPDLFEPFLSRLEASTRAQPLRPSEKVTPY